ncbi:SRPBCC domain-containing protein [Mycetocola zhadangensis]|uniref:SRPBCC domain-containing protein n=1 Tax=Mycetocola zhadangensis TaxID=1164595 RepID=UPI003A4D71D0
MTATYELHRGFTLLRTLAVPPEVMFRMWTDPGELGWFFNPAMPTPTEPVEVDLRVGGAWRQLMVIDEFSSYLTGGIYREIAPVEKLVFSWGAVGGWPEIDMARLDDVPLITVIFDPTDAAEDRGDARPATDMFFSLALPDHLTESQVAAWEEAGIEENWGKTLDRLVEATKGETGAA